MSGSQRYPWLHAALAGQGLVITSSRRLARELRQAFDAQQSAAGLLAWPSANVFFWQDWLQRLLDEQLQSDAPVLLDGPASVLLWEQSLDAAVKTDLLSPTSLVREARRAWQRVQEWRISLEQLGKSAMSRDEHWFARAALDYQHQLDAGNWLDQAQLACYCAAAIRQRAVTVPPRVAHAGFDRPSPALAVLLAALQESGSKLSAAPLPMRNAAPGLRSYADSTMMWRAAGQWARERLQQAPAAQLAIVVPDLEADSGAIARKVREGFAPGWQLARGRYRESVEVSYGQPLSAFPAIAVAGLCLRFVADGLRSADLSVLLRSEFIGNSDRAERCRFELRLRSLPDSLWQPERLLIALDSNSREGEYDGLRMRLREFAAVHESRQERRTPAAWAKTIDELLTAIGWPGDEQPDSAEFQLQNRWRQLLNELSRLGIVRRDMTLGASVRHLQQIAGEAVYQPETQGGGLRVLGMLETVGLEFDFLWLGGMDSSRWPAASNPVALVNRQLQREAAMPDATPADTLEFAQRTLQRILQAAGQVEIAWARQEDDKELVPSPLIDVDAAAVSADQADPSWFAARWLAAPLVSIHADEAPPVKDGETVSGGAYTVQAMREEPFSAFAKGRLHVQELDQLQPGLTAKARGTVVHGALQRLLRDLPSQQDMRGWSQESRARRIDDAAWHPLASFWHLADPILRRLLQLEKERLLALLTAFLDKECERENFQVEGLEQKSQLRFGPVTLSLQIDRLDRLDDSSLLITDYKASEPKPFLDKHKSLKQLQLCVYARALEEDSVGGLLYTYINSREIKYVGEGGSLSGSKISATDWSAVLETWCAEVDVLLKRFADGEVGVNAVQEVKNARPLAILSRFAELPDAG